MSDYIDRYFVCYGLEKMADVDSQHRAIRRAKKYVEEFPAADVRKVGVCHDCEHWDIVNRHMDTSGNYIANCKWFSRNNNDIQTSSKDFCSFFCKWKYTRRD